MTNRSTNSLTGIASRVFASGSRDSRSSRSTRRSVQLDLEESSEPAAAPPAAGLVTSAEETERAHAIQEVRAAVLALPLLQREIIALCDLEELPYAEVALILNCPLGTVRSRLHRARAQLAQQLQHAAPPCTAAPTSRAQLTSNDDPALLTCRGSVT